MSNRQFAELQQWSREVARDPAAPAFLPLARSYRREGRLEAAIQLCVRALARNPAHLEGHALLAQLYLESGDRERAGDEWSIVLHLDPDHFEAQRGLGFLWLERGEYASAHRHLERAAALRPGDAAVRGALELLAERSGDERVEPVGRTVAPVQGRPAPAGREVVPGRVFEPLLSDPACRGVLVLDDAGVVLAGGVGEGGRGSAELLAARLGGVVAEATRALMLLGAGPYQGLRVETTEAVLKILPCGDGLFVLIIGEPSASAAALRRLAGAALELVGGAREGGAE